ncbi:MAG: hypothetical protein PHD76_03255 [Methylacidiphilales bacterium]|nr:hypothetical protein [Candidatus Methylacidiphilales bacterium]
MDSIRPTVIGILNRVASSDEPISFAENSYLDEIKLVSQLIDDGYLSGEHVEDERGIPCNACVDRITLRGREYADQLEQKHGEASPKGKFKKWGLLFLVWLLGIATAVVTQALLKYLNLN